MAEEPLIFTNLSPGCSIMVSVVGSRLTLPETAPWRYTLPVPTLRETQDDHDLHMG